MHMYIHISLHCCEACSLNYNCECNLAWDLQDYIENENARLEREQQFWAKEIVVKIEYKFCPNLTIIDTPGQHHSYLKLRDAGQC